MERKFLSFTPSDEPAESMDPAGSPSECVGGCGHFPWMHPLTSRRRMAPATIDLQFDAFDLRFDHRVDQFEEALKIIVPLVKQGEVDFHGEYSSAPDCAMLPKPSREIPVLIASKGPRMLDLTAEYADQWNTAWFGQPTNYLARRDDMMAALDKAGRDRDSLAVTAGIVVNFPDLMDAGEGTDDPDRVFKGTVDELAVLLAEYKRNGCEHVIAQLMPLTEESIARYAQAKVFADSMHS